MFKKPTSKQIMQKQKIDEVTQLHRQACQDLITAADEVIQAINVNRIANTIPTTNVVPLKDAYKYQ